MRQLFCLLPLTILICFALGSCTSTKEAIQSHYSILVAEAVSVEQLSDAVSYLEENIGKEDEEAASHMVAAYEACCHAYIRVNPEETELADLAAYYDNATGTMREKNMKKGERADFYENMRNACLRFTWDGENPELRVDYGELSDRFGEDITDSLKRLYQMEETAQDSPAMKNAEIVIPYEQILSRAEDVEALLKAYPGEHLIMDSAGALYESYLDVYLQGAGNSPVFDPETDLYREDLRQATQNYLAEGTGTVLAEILAGYRTYLESIGYSLDFSKSEEAKVFLDTCDNLIHNGMDKLAE